MNVLAIGCHPDDIEVACAGTLIKYQKAGHQVTVCHVANGNLGHVEIPSERLRVMRAAEAKKAGSLAGIEVVTCDVGDLLVYDNQEQRNQVAEVIRQVQPDVIITHAPEDYMPDHVAVSKLVFAASFAASVPQYGTGSPAKLTPIYYMDTLAGIGFQPTEYVDISHEIDLKLEMLECHESQLKWMRDHDGIDFAEFVRTIARFRGIQCGTSYAEGFIRCLAYGKVTAGQRLP